MLLAMCEAEHPDELEADLQQYYGLNWEEAGRAYSYAHAAALTAQLPRGSRIVRAIDPETEWGWTEGLLSRIEYWAHALVWSQTKDGRHGRNRPEQVMPPGHGDPEVQRARRAAKRRHVDEVLGKG